MTAQHPIGIFDSGVGGLTIAHAIHSTLANESILYFGDTAHHPYGEKSATAIQHYAQQVCQTLLDMDCKLILIACNSASTAAYETLRAYVADRIPIVNVIEPVISYIKENYKDTQIGLIGTKQTVASKIYDEKISALALNIKTRALATPLLAPIIEEGFAEHQIVVDALTTYLSQPILQDISALILGCTHYPLIKSQVRDYYKGQVDVIDASLLVAESVAQVLSSLNLLNSTSPTQNRFYITDPSDAFSQTATRFFGDSITLQHYPLWGQNTVFTQSDTIL